MKNLVVMAKAPEAGRVKTRLARDIGVAEATRVYRTILTRTLRRLTGDPRWQTWIAVAPDRAMHSPLWPSNVNIVGQGAGNLGDRMQRVFDTLPGGPIVIVGSDIPGISPEDIAGAFSLLGQHDAVIGPAPDGGYWLVGQKRCPRIHQIFEDVRWSGPHAMEDTLANLKGATVGRVGQKTDVDTQDDYRAWCATG